MPSPSPLARRSGAVLGALLAVLLVLDAVFKFLMPPQVAAEFTRLALPLRLAPILGSILLAATALYAVPRTSILGAIALTGYLGGAVVTHLRQGDPLFTHVLFPVYLGILVWGSLYLRDPHLRSLIPFRIPPP